MAECPKRLPSFSDATRLLTQVLDDSQGQVSASVYDTARLMSHTPWLPGHTARLDYLLSHQSANGTWGGPGGYTIVPTLSATEALLTEVRRAGDLHSRVRAVQAVDAGLMALRDLFGRPVVSTPDTIAVEFLVPALVQAINATLDSLALVTPVSVPSHWLGSRLIVPKTLDPGLYKAFIARLDHGIPLPDKTWAALEAFGPHAVSAEFIRPSGGAVAGSPSATASWLGPAADLEHPTAAASVRYLEQVQARGNGTVPAVVPITYFEAAWVLNSLALGQINYETPPILLDRLEASLDVDGAPAGPGIPADADDTAAILSALARHGRAHDPAVLMRYRTDGYFTCFPDERTPSVSTNAHVLEAFAVFLKSRPRARPRLRSAMSMTTDWLLEMQCAESLLVRQVACFAVLRNGVLRRRIRCMRRCACALRDRVRVTMGSRYPTRRRFMGAMERDDRGDVIRGTDPPRGCGHSRLRHGVGTGDRARGNLRRPVSLHPRQPTNV